MFLKFKHLLLGCVVGAAAHTAAAGQTIEGIDVSQWQGSIDWTRVGATDKAFAFVKATDSQHLTDPRFLENVNGARDNGLVTGVYHFATPFSYDRNTAIDTASGSDAVDEARWFVQQAGGFMTAGYLRPVLDLEVNESLGRSVLSAWADEFLDEVESLVGVRPMIYANTFWATNFLDAQTVATDLWVANWGATSNPPTGSWNSFAFWQYTDQGAVDGINPAINTVDLNRFYGTSEDFSAFVITPEPSCLALLLLSSGMCIRRHRQQA